MIAADLGKLVMKNFLISFFLVTSTAFVTVVQGAQVVQYCEGTTSSRSRDIITFVDGSVSQWYSNTSFLSFIGPALLVFSTQERGTIYKNGSRLSVINRGGDCVRKNGIYAQVVEERGDGEFLILDDGTVLRFDSYDMYDTGWWLPPYPILLTSDLLYMWNLEEGKRVWVQ